MSSIWPSPDQQGAQLMLMMLAAGGAHHVHQVTRLQELAHQYEAKQPTLDILLLH